MRKIFVFLTLMFNIFVLCGCNEIFYKESNNVQSSTNQSINKNTTSSINKLNYIFDEDSHYTLNKDGTISNVGSHVYVNDKCYICDVHESIKFINFELVNNENEYAIEKCDYDGNIIIPSMYKGIPVTTILDNALIGNDYIIIIPKSILSIGRFAFINSVIYLEHDEILNDFAENWAKDCNVYLGYDEGKYKIDIENNYDLIKGFFVDLGDELPSMEIPVKQGYKFAGIFDELDGGTQYIDSNGNCFKNWDKNHNDTLYIHWESEMYTIVFDANGGSGTMNSLQISYDEAYENEVDLPYCAFSFNKYIFKGWSLNKNDSVMFNYNDEIYEVINYYMNRNHHNNNIVLYAIWDFNQTLEITYDFSRVEEEVVQHSSYNVFDGVSILTSTGVELKTKATAASDCTLNGKLLDTSEVRTCKIDYSATFMVNGAEYTETASRYVTIRDEIIKEGNLVANGDFKLGLYHWNLATHEGGFGDLVLDKTDVMGVQKNAAKVVMSGVNWTDDSSPRLQSANYSTGDITETFTMIGGQNYKVTFKAKALTTKYVNVSIGQLMTSPPWYEGFTSSEQTYKAEVTSEWKEFSYEFTATHATLENCSILFSMGQVAPTANVITTLWFTDVYVGVYSDDITDETAPTINGLNDVTIAASSTPYNVLNGITANDNVDGNISEAVVAKYNGNTVTTIDVSIPGEYVISYEVSDAAGNKATGSRKIIVVDAGDNLLFGINSERLKEDSWCESWILQTFSDETDGSIKVHTLGGGEQPYVNQINLNNLPIVGGQSYTLTFDIKTSVSMSVRFVQNGGAYTEYAAADVFASSDYQTVTLNISAAEVDSKNKLTFELGLVGIDITFYIRNIKLIQN